VDKLFVCQHVCDMRGMILVTATMFSTDVHIHHCTRASVLGASEMVHLPNSMVKFVAGQADNAYFVLALSLHTGL
jgi:hypothetical protein